MLCISEIRILISKFPSEVGISILTYLFLWFSVIRPRSFFGFTFSSSKAGKKANSLRLTAPHICPSLFLIDPVCSSIVPLDYCHFYAWIGPKSNCSSLFFLTRNNSISREIPALNGGAVLGQYPKLLDRLIEQTILYLSQHGWPSLAIMLVSWAEQVIFLWGRSARRSNGRLACAPSAGWRSRHPGRWEKLAAMPTTSGRSGMAVRMAWITVFTCAGDTTS